jgi:argininosuccinate lyase
LFCCALIGVHLSRLAEAVVLFTSAEFAYFELSDAYATGSSLMPQKKNPDVFELARGKAGTLIGLLTGLLAVLKGLPSTYDKDLQEDKEPVFRAFDILEGLLPVLAGALETLSVRPQAMEQAIEASMMTTDLADFLVERGIPFREAHGVVGQIVRLAARLGAAVDQVPLEEIRALGPQTAGLGVELFEALEAWRSVNRRLATGGTAQQAVGEQLAAARSLIGKKAKNFTGDSTGCCNL